MESSFEYYYRIWNFEPLLELERNRFHHGFYSLAITDKKFDTFRHFELTSQKVCIPKWQSFILVLILQQTLKMMALGFHDACENAEFDSVQSWI